jgi:small subunit ribosomal protein S8
MSLNDPLGNVMSFINNYEKLGRKVAPIKNNSKLIREVLKVMKDNMYIGNYNEIKDDKKDKININLLGNINKCGVIKPRYKVKKDEYEKFEKRFLPAKDFGILIVTTSKGIMTHKEAKEKAIGGKIIAFVY